MTGAGKNRAGGTSAEAQDGGRSALFDRGVLAIGDGLQAMTPRVRPTRIVRRAPASRAAAS